MNNPTKYCPACHELIAMAARQCDRCGHTISETANFSTVVETAVQQALQDRYTILQEIGRGGMAVVFKTTQKSLDRLVALKVLPLPFIPHQGMAAELTERFKREALKVAALSHDNIVKIYDWGMAREVYYIAMEYIDGENLETKIKRGPLAIDELQKWIIPVVDALSHAHKKGIVHRDVKSANILISREERPVLTDFGIAQALDVSQLVGAKASSRITRYGAVLGTWPYISPEQARGDALDGRSDLYSVGVVMYECLTGTPPFSGNSEIEIKEKIIRQAPSSPSKIRSDIPDALEKIVLRCLAKNPAKRYRNGDELLQALADIARKSTTGRIKLHTKLAPDAMASTSSFSSTTIRSSRVPAWLQRSVRAPTLKWVFGILGAMAIGGFLVNKMVRPRPQSSGAEATQLLPAATTPDSLTLAPVSSGSREQILLLEQQAREYAADEKYLTPLEKNVYAISQEIKKLDPNNATANELLDAVKNRLARDLQRAYQAEQAQRLHTIGGLADSLFAGDQAFHERMQKNLAGALERLGRIKHLLEEARENMSQENWELAWEKGEEILVLLPKAKSALNLQREIINRLLDGSHALIAKMDYRPAAEKLEQANKLKPNDKGIAGLLQHVKAELQMWLGIELVLVKGDSFQMGNTFEKGDSDERPVHWVKLEDFYIGRFEITFAQYDAYCDAAGGRRPKDNSWGRDNRPAINISWKEAATFCDWLSRRTGKQVHLPTEAQWEFAARERGKNLQWAGTNTAVELSDWSWFKANSNGMTHPVGGKRPNSLGLYDLSGNAYEWCRDLYDKNFYKSSPNFNPLNDEKGDKSVVRGGSIANSEKDLRSVNRQSMKGDRWEFPTGFRVAATP